MSTIDSRILIGCGVYDALDQSDPRDCRQPGQVRVICDVICSPSLLTDWLKGTVPSANQILEIVDNPVKVGSFAYIGQVTHGFLSESRSWFVYMTISSFSGRMKPCRGLCINQTGTQYLLIMFLFIRITGIGF